MKPDSLGTAALISVALTAMAVAAAAAAFQLTPAALDWLGVPDNWFRELAYGFGVMGLAAGIYIGIGRAAAHYSRWLRDRR